MRVASALVTAAALGSVLAVPSGAAQAGCCASRIAAPQVIYAEPNVARVQPAPAMIELARPEIVVTERPAVPAYQVNQGPVYSGPGADYAPPVYEAAEPIPFYPYLSNYRWRSFYAPRAHRPRPHVSAYRYPPRYAPLPGEPLRRRY